jgi:uncharacterized membrane protein
MVGRDDGASERTQSDALVQLQMEMERYWVHARLRLQVIAAIVAVIAAMVAFGHARADAGDLAVTPSALGEMLAGYPTVIVLLVISVLVRRRAELYRRSW